MALPLINIGPQNQQLGDSLFASFTKCNAAITQINSGGAPGIFTGTAGVYAVTATGSPTSGQSFGELISAGTTNADVALLVQNQAASATFFKIFGDGHGTLGPTNALGLSWNTTGNLTIAAPSNAAPALTVGCTVTSQIATFGPTVNGYIQVSDGTYNAQLGVAGGASEGWVGSSASQIFSIRTAATDRLTISATGAVTIATPSSGQSLTISSVSGGYCIGVTGSSAAGNSYGIQIKAGTNTSDLALSVLNQAGSGGYLSVRGDGQVQMFSGPASGYALTISNPNSTAGTSFGVQI